MTVTDLFTDAIRLREGGLVSAEERRMGDVGPDQGWQVVAFHVEREGPFALGRGAVHIVPRGRWHRLEVEEPSDLMSIVLRSGTRLERRAEGTGTA